jgi:hypothetical protein
MSRRALDLLFASGAAAIAVLMVVLGFVLADQASFAEDYVKEQLGEQKITFATAEELKKDEENPANAEYKKITQWKEGSSCLNEYAGKAMTTGKMAECYGNYYIGMHMARTAALTKVDGQNMGWDGQTYATLGTVRTDLSAKIAAAKTANNTDEAAKLQKQLDAATSLRSTMQTGETLRGLLLTSYGFSIFGDKAALASTVCYLGAVVLVIIAAGGFVHAAMTRK